MATRLETTGKQRFNSVAGHRETKGGEDEVGTSEGASKGWTEERRARQRETARKTWQNKELRKRQSEIVQSHWNNNPERRQSQGLKRHQAAKNVEWDRFQGFLTEANEEGCILWSGGTRHGYAIFSYVRKQGEKAVSFSAARWLWKRVRGPIPDGMTIEHDCHTKHPSCIGGITCTHRLCVNLEHLRLVPAPENTSLGRSRQERLGLVQRNNGRFVGGKGEAK